jgi:hypothetical protein
VGKLSLACWVFFAIMSMAFLPLGTGVVLALHALPAAARLMAAFLVVGALWWGPFGYAMYLALAVMRNGDRRLLKRGIHGTAVVLSAKRTRTVIQEGDFAWEAPRVWKYRLRVTIPGRAPYETDCSICIPNLAEGTVVNVAAAPHNHRRVTIDVGQDVKDGPQVPRPVPGHRQAAALVIPAGTAFSTSWNPAASQTASDAQRIGLLTQLGQLHRQGILTDSEFAAQKAQLLDE